MEKKNDFRMLMKPNVWLLVMCMAMLSSCKKDPELTVSTNQISLSADGGSVSLKVKSNTDWSITGAKSWLTISPSTGSENGTVVISAQENEGVDSRDCKLTIATDDAEMIQTIDVKQEGSEVLLSVSPSDIYFTSKEGESAELKITTQTAWKITDVPSWLNVNQQGNGTTTIKITTKSANETDEPRTAELKVSAGDKISTVTVTQEAGKPVCYVEPINIVALYDEICFELSATSNVNTFKFGYFEEDEYKRLTEKEIIAYVEEGEMNKFADDYIFFPSGFNDNTKYYICTIAYDENGDAGELKYATVTTPEYIDYDNDAFVSYSDISYGSGGFQFTVTKEGFCDTYHLIYGNVDASIEGYSRSLYAFQIKYFMNKGKKHWFAENWDLEIVTNYPNNHTFSCSTYTIPYFPLIVIYSWGVFKDGTLSSDMLGIQWNTSENNVPSLLRSERRISDKNDIFTRVISRSAEEKKATKK